jgi:hypothetical protein
MTSKPARESDETVKPTEHNSELPLTDGKTGAGDRDRTGDIQLGKLAFYR